MTIEELEDYTREFKKSQAEGFNNLTRGEAAYKPMDSLVKCLRPNDFTVYVVSGTDRMLVRPLAKEMFDIPANNVIGTDTTMGNCTGDRTEDAPLFVVLYRNFAVIFGIVLIFLCMIK